MAGCKTCGKKLPKAPTGRGVVKTASQIAGRKRIKKAKP